jgi:biotin-[acetyl-CoA-carboxylase] ligase BirA-like protein
VADAPDAAGVDNATRNPATPHLHWGAEALWEQLQPVLPGLSVEVVARLDSTNTRLLERARDVGGDPDADLAPCLLVAEEQTAGRGRLGRGWVSAPGRSLTFSLALPMATLQWGGLSLAVGVALADALDPLAASPAATCLALKWPNDLWLRDAAAPAGGRKLGGILIETVAVGTQRMVVVGVGLNVRPREAAASGAATPLHHGYACLQELSPAASAPAVLHCVARPLLQALVNVTFSGVLKRVAVKLSKICTDLRLLNSGPRAGIGEIRLPPVQAGSSIMPGKVNPVIPEVVIQVGDQVIGNDAAITLAGSQGQFELNVRVPLIARNLLDSINLLTGACSALDEKVIQGVEPNLEMLDRHAESTLATATALNPHIGYDKAAEVVKEAASSGRTLREVAIELGVDESVLDEALNHRKLARPHD